MKVALVSYIQSLILRFVPHLGILLLCGALAACGSNSVLFNKLSQDEGNEIYSALLEAGIPAEKSTAKEGITISVPKALSSEALKVLNTKGLPRDKKTSIGEVFKKDSMISSPLEERARYLYALSQELEQTLMRIDGVLSARVHIVLPERSTPGEPLSPSSAAVFVKYAQESSFPAYIPRVRELVFKSIPGIIGTADTSITVAALPSEHLQENCVPLLWYGPMALHPSDRWIFLSIFYFLILGWVASIVLVWLQAKPSDQWPEFLKKIRSRINK